jgi:pimeloyl-ACP methyl ester carboxylesterase
MDRRETNGIAYGTSGWPLDVTKPTLVFIHGAGGSHVLWERQIDALAERANTLALDLPGHGKSRGEGMTTIEDYAQAVAGLIRATEAPRPVPCGLSMGGAITQQLLLDHADVCVAGILIGTGARLRVMPLILKTIEEDFSAYIGSFLSFAASEKTDPAKLKGIAEATAQGDPQVALGDFKACDAFDVMERLPSIDLPVLVITSEEDKLTPPKYGIFLEENIRGASRVHIPEAGHLVPAEKPQEVNQAIVQFLDRHLKAPA